MRNIPPKSAFNNQSFYYGACNILCDESIDIYMEGGMEGLYKKRIAKNTKVELGLEHFVEAVIVILELGMQRILPIGLIKLWEFYCQQKVIQHYITRLGFTHCVL